MCSDRGLSSSDFERSDENCVGYFWNCTGLVLSSPGMVVVR